MSVILRVLPVLAAAGLLVASASAIPPAMPPMKSIATITRDNVRAEVIAQKLTEGLAPRASVEVIGFQRIGGVWYRVSTHPLGAFFWKVVVYPHAICKLSITGKVLTISVLETPSLGCTSTRTIRLVP